MIYIRKYYPSTIFAGVYYKAYKNRRKTPCDGCALGFARTFKGCQLLRVGKECKLPATHIYKEPKPPTEAQLASLRYGQKLAAISVIQEKLEFLAQENVCNSRFLLSFLTEMMTETHKNWEIYKASRK